MHLNESIVKAFNRIQTKKDLFLEERIDITNRILKYLHNEIEQYNFRDDLVDRGGKILKAIFKKVDSDYNDLGLRLKEITPATRLTQSELFTGGNVGLSLESELTREIRSSNRIDLLVSFIKWKAIVILKDAFHDFTSNGGQLRVITTTYMGATDAKAICELSKMPNTQIKVSYNLKNERLHAKAYLFYRNSGYHTGYIGSSNFSRSALTDGLEWNLKVTAKEVPHIIDKCQKTFETYWQNSEFEEYQNTKSYQKLRNHLQENRNPYQERTIFTFFDIKPYHYQRDILEKLQVERNVHNRYKNLVVAATGTGKTIISAFDFKRFKTENTQANLLFVAHKIEILKQARNTYRNILLDQNFGELLGDGAEPTDNRNVFATVQSLTTRIKENRFSRDYYDFVVIDEAHHIQAKSYQSIIRAVEPTVLLGLTATPERMDGKSILPDFENHIAAEIRLADALNKKLLCPFQYFALSDSVDLDRIKWINGQYDKADLTRAYIYNDQRVRDIISNLQRYCRDVNDVTALGFCTTKVHAEYMDRQFRAVGLKSDFLTSDNSKRREDILNALKQKEINYLFVVDMVNEGLDIPQVDTLLFLRPTESLTIFLQQLGRGLRLYENKDILTVLDFVGNAHSEYDFESKFRALVGKTNSTIRREIESDFMHLPLGCSIVLEKKAKEVILKNIARATSFKKSVLIKRIQQFSHQTSLPLTLSNFLSFNNISHEKFYDKLTWTELLNAAQILTGYHPLHEQRFSTLLRKKWAATNSLSYFKYVLQLANKKFVIKNDELSDLDRLYLTMLHYDFWPARTIFATFEESISPIGKNPHYLEEIKEYLQHRIDQIDFEEMPCKDLDYVQPLQLHARYTRDQILAAFRLSTLHKQSSNREGTAEIRKLNTELLFINLQKSEEDFSPTTMYEDYAINETLFHWQSQNNISADSPKGFSYVNQGSLNKKILLFIRESKQDENGDTRGYVFAGLANFVKYEGSKPMSITWKLERPIPEFLWSASAKMAVG